MRQDNQVPLISMKKRSNSYESAIVLSKEHKRKTAKKAFRTRAILTDISTMNS